MTAASVQRRRLKRATRMLTDACDGYETVAMEVGRGKSTVQRWTDVNNTDDFININAVATLEEIAGQPIITEMLARMAGGVFVRLPGAIAGVGGMAERVVELAADVGKIAGAVQASLTDGSCGVAEAANLREQLGQLIAAAAGFDQQLAEIEAGERE